MNVLAIDPGPVESAFVIWDGKEIHDKGKVQNESLIRMVRDRESELAVPPSYCIIEQIKSYGKPVADSVFDTVYWSGRFREAWGNQGFFDRVPRIEVRKHICHHHMAKDGHIIQALKDRFEPGLLPRQRPKGILKGLVADTWQALALAVTWLDQHN